jgi:PAS domain S-box-containing protein
MKSLTSVVPGLSGTGYHTIPSRHKTNRSQRRLILALLLALLALLGSGIWFVQYEAQHFGAIAIVQLGGLLLSMVALGVCGALIWQRRVRLQDQALLESEARFRSITEQMRDVVFVSDDLGRLEYVSPAVQDLVGFTPEELIGLPFTTFLHPDEVPAVRVVFGAMIMAGSTARHMEQRIRRKDGSTFSAELSVVCFDRAGAYGTLGVIRDITERKQVEAVLQAERATLAQRVEERTADLSRANTELAHALRAKDAFLATMSHELRTPLNAILGISESLEEAIYGQLTPEQERALGTITQSGRHLLALINDILDLAKIDAGKLALDFQPIMVADVCRSSLRLVHEAAQKKGVPLSFEISDPQLILRADPRRLKQILVNLLSNAVKFTPAGGQVALMATTEIDDAQVSICFTVQDTGIGIPPSAIGQLFTPFTQLDSRLARQYEGSGLGLALVRRLVDLHGGSVDVESAGVPGQGSRFAVRLPVE